MSLNELPHPLAQTLHILSAVVWVGGMVFAHQILRPPAAALLEPPQRLSLWVRVFGRFFPLVWAAVTLLLITGFWMMFASFGGMHAPLYIHLMMGLGLLMTGIFLLVFFGPYPRLRQAVAGQDWPAGGRQLGRIRTLVGLNTILGLTVIAVAAAGRFLVL